MDNHENTRAIEKEIQLLNLQYEDALQKGEEFRILRDLKDRIKELKQKLGVDGDGQEKR